METSASITRIAAALLTFSGEVDTIFPDATNTAFGTRYASLPNIQKKIKEPLKKAGLIIVQMPIGKDGLETILLHGPSGEWMKALHTMTPEDDTPTHVGQAIAFQRRYAITAILSLIIAEETPTAGTTATPEGVDDLRQWFDQNHYESCVKRINKGNKGVVDAAIKAFQMKPEAMQLLRDAEKKYATAEKAKK